MAAAPPSRECPAGILQRLRHAQEDRPLSPSHAEADAPPLPPFLHSKNKGYEASGEIAAAASASSTQIRDRLIRVKVEEVSEHVNVQTQGGVGGALQGRKEGRSKLQRKIQNKKVSSENKQDPSQGVSLPSTSARPTSSNHPSLSSKIKGSQPAANDNGPANAVPKKRLKSPIVQVVRSPGVNLILSQESPRTIGVKRLTPTTPRTSSESIKYVRSSPPRKKKFKDIVVQEGIKCTKKVSLDVATRWNSTHLMIKTTLEYRKAFAALKLQDPLYTCQPTSDEWDTTQSVCNMLELFLDATMVVSGTLYPTAHLYFHELWKIHLTLEREATNEEAVIRSMVVVMHTKFMKYWKLSYLTICLPVILDLRYKLKFLEMCLKTGLDDEFATHFARVE